MSVAGRFSGGSRVDVRSPAKLNLDLRVLGRRDDGFHELETTMLALDRCDRIAVRIVAGGGVRLSLTGAAASPDVPEDSTNLAWLAADGVLALAREPALASPRTGVALELEKLLPSQAGLGGGSSNAAAAALATALLLGIDPDDPELLELVSGLGSDCAFFLAARRSGLARCTGRGERVRPLALPPAGEARVFAVVTPELGCRAAAVYGALEPADWGEEREALDVARFFAAPLEEARVALFNALEPAALRAHADLRLFRDELDAAGGGHFRLAGSGSSFFGLFDDERAASAFLRRLTIARKGRDHGLRAGFVARPLGAGVGV